MNIKDLPTPSMVVDLDKMEKNIKKFHDLAKENNKEIWPMTKTHKSTEIMKMQLDMGATGLLCGTLDECEAAESIGAKNIMFAYPVSEEQSIKRVINLAKNVDGFICRQDNLEVMEKLNAAAKDAGVTVNYTVIIDVGLHRFGIQPETAVDFVKEAQEFSNLEFLGISTHPGHVYSAEGEDELPPFINDEVEKMQQVRKDLKDAGIDVEMVTVGSTPTYFGAIDAEGIDIYHPGNYIFLDAIQVSLGVATEDDCAFTVLGTITSHPAEDTYVMDTGSKCLGLDAGAHGNEAIVGHGIMVGHEDAIIQGLSEEVGKISAKNGELELGERVEIIPNHSCSSANNTSFIYGHRNGTIEKAIEVNIRGNSQNFFK